MGHVMVLPELRDVDEIQPLGVGAPEIVWAYRVSALQPQVAIEDEPPGCRLLGQRDYPRGSAPLPELPNRVRPLKDGVSAARCSQLHETAVQDERVALLRVRP
jgi:hypothetical protein